MAAAPKVGLGALQQSESDPSDIQIMTPHGWAPAMKDEQSGQWTVDHSKLEAAGAGGFGSGQGPDPKTLDDLAKARANFTNLDNLRATANSFLDRNRTTPTGSAYRFGMGSLAAGVPGAPEGLAAMQRDSTTLATALKADNMRLTQGEFYQFLKNSPSIGNTYEQNKQIVDDINRAHTKAAAKSAFLSSWVEKHQSLAGYEPRWLAFQQQHFDNAGNYYHDPSQNPLNNPKAQAGARMKAMSAAAQSRQAAPDQADPLGFK